MKKIIFVTKALWIGGIESALINLLNQLDYSKYDVTLLIYQANLEQLELINSHVNVIIADRKNTYSFSEAYKYHELFSKTEISTNPSTLHKLLMWMVPGIRYLENELFIRYIKRNMKNQHYDTAVAYSDVAGEITVRCIDADKYLMFYHHGVLRHVYHDNVAYKKCDSVIAVSTLLEMALKEYYPQYASKVNVLPNLIDVDSVIEKSKSEVEEEFCTSEFNIVTVGRIAYEKGIDIAVKTCVDLIDEGLTNIKWWIVGNGPEMNSIRDLVKINNLEKHFIFVGMKSNPYPYIRMADLYVQPSRAESFGLAMLEALIIGKTVISTETMGAREIMKYDTYGSFHVGKEESLSDIILEYYKSGCFCDQSKADIKNIEKRNQQILQKLDMLL